MNNVSELIPTRHSLLIRLKDWSDNEGWKDFFETYWKLIYSAAVKAGLTDAEAQDVVQETVISVFKSLPQFEYDQQKGSFKNWLLQLTGWRILDQFRRRQRQIQHRAARSSETGTSLDAMDRVPDPVSRNLEMLWDAEWENNLLDAAVARVKRRVDAKQYQIFDLCTVKEWPMTKVARTLGVSVSYVYLTRHRVGKLLKKEIATLQNKPL